MKKFSCFKIPKIGNTTVGKSLTINRLLGVHFIEDDDDNLLPSEGERVIAPVGNIEEENAGCTLSI